MKKINFVYNKKIIYILLFIVIIALSYFLISYLNVSKDSIKFKNEYESLNDKINEKNNKEYRKISMPRNNPFKYSNEDELLTKINNKESFVVYFGFPECPWCRSVIETLTKVADDMKLDSVYYLNIKDIRDTMEIDKDGKIVTTKKGTEGYYKLISILSNVLEDYTINDANDNEVQTGEKRIYAPNVITIVEGVPQELKTGISSLQTDPNMELTDKMKQDTYSQFKCNIDCIVNTNKTCSTKKSCD